MLVCVECCVVVLGWVVCLDMLRCGVLCWVVLELCRVVLYCVVMCSVALFSIGLC